MTKQIEYSSDLKDQMKTRLSANRVSALLLKSIFLISAGGNDAFDFFSQNRSSDSTEVQQFSEAMISTYDSHVKVRTLAKITSAKVIGACILILLYPKEHLRTLSPRTKNADSF
jgi:hypothetical protein